MSPAPPPRTSAAPGSPAEGVALPQTPVDGPGAGGNGAAAGAGVALPSAHVFERSHGAAAAMAALEINVNDPIAVAAHLATVGRVHLIGIGGTGMSGLARILKKRGYVVSGSDGRASHATAVMEGLGIPISTPHCENALDFERGLVIASAAIPGTNPEVLRARAVGVPVVKYAVGLAAAAATRRVLAVAGCHGKTTTSAMTAFLLRQAGVDCGYVIGGNVQQLEGNAADGHAPEFVVEACEYDRSFLNFTPALAAITNLDADHLDYYKSYGAVVEAFAQFAQRIRRGGVLVTTAQAWAELKSPVESAPGFSTRDVRVRTVGPDSSSSIRILPLGATTHGAGRSRGYSMRLFMGRDDLGAFTVCVPGTHNLMNAAMAILLALESKADLEKVRAALPEFRGVDRRMTLKRRSPDLTILDDYGHHPTELRATIRAARDHYGGRLVFIFQPHQHSRTKLLFNDFVDALSLADRVILPPIYAARDSAEDRASVSSVDLARALVARGVDAVSVDNLDLAADEAFRSKRAGDVILTSGAGDVDQVADELVRRSDQNI